MYQGSRQYECFFFWGKKTKHTAEPSTSNHLLTNVFLVRVYYALSRTHTALFFIVSNKKERIAPFFFLFAFIPFFIGLNTFDVRIILCTSRNKKTPKAINTPKKIVWGGSSLESFFYSHLPCIAHQPSLSAALSHVYFREQVIVLIYNATFRSVCSFCLFCSLILLFSC